MHTYFIRHGLAVRPDERAEIVDRDLIAVHYPDAGPKDSRSLDPDDYTRSAARTVIRYFNGLSEDGGYVWAQYQWDDTVKIGVVEPGTPIELQEFHWRRPIRKERLSRDAGDPAIIKTLALQVAHSVPKHELISFRAARPRQGTLCRWHKVGDRLKTLIENGTLPFTWRSMAPSQLEIAWSEFLRSHQREDLPHLQFLLMPPGRTLKDVDLYGICRSGKLLFGQVTYKSQSSSKSKIDELRTYKGSDSELLFFCDCASVERSDEVTFVPNSLLDEWMDSNRPHTEGLIDSIE